MHHIQAYLTQVVLCAALVTCFGQPLTTMVLPERVYLTLKHRIVSSPLRLIGNLPVKSRELTVQPITKSIIEPALSEEVVISMDVGKQREELYVAGTGD